MLAACGLCEVASARDFTLKEVFAEGIHNAFYVSCPQTRLELKSNHRATALQAWEVVQTGGPCTVPRGCHRGLSWGARVGGLLPVLTEK